MKRIFNYSYMLLAYMILSFSANAATIYVNATTGNDGNSGATPALAKQTIAGATGALSIAASGDVIELAAGVYNETFTVSQNVTFRGPQTALSPSGPSRYSTTPAPATEAVIQNVSGNVVTVANGFNVRFEGLTIVNLNTGRAIRVPSVHNATIEVYRCRLFGTNAGGVAIIRAENCANLVVQDNHLYKTTTLTGAINAVQALSATITGNLIEAVANISFGTIYSNSSSNVLIQNNVIRTNNFSGIELDDPAANVQVLDNDVLVANTSQTVTEGGVTMSGGNYNGVSILRNVIMDAFNAVNIRSGNLNGDNVVISDNLFLSTGAASANLVGIRHEGNGAVDAEDNAWGTNGNRGPDIASNPGQAGNFQITGAAAALIDYTPWMLCNQDAVPTVFTDAGITGAGFQPGIAPPGVLASAFPTPVCVGYNLQLTTNIVGGTYSWTGPAAFSSAVQNPVIPITGIAQSGVYSLTATLNFCTGMATTPAVTVEAPAAPTATAGAAPITASGITVYFNGVGGYAQYRIAYRVLGATTWQYTQVFTAQISYTPGPNYGKRYGAVTGLQIGTRYEFAVQAACGSFGSGGYSPLSAVAQASTNAQTSLSCYNPTDIFTESASVTSGLVSFQVDNGTYSCVQIAYGPYNQPPTSLTWKTVNVPAPGSPYMTQNYTITGLTTGVKYGARVRTICAAGCPAVTTNLTSWSGIYPFTPGATREGDSGENISEVSIENAVLSVYPNPSHGTFRLKADGTEPNTPVQIYDMTGKIVHQTASIENQETHIDLSGQPAGVYLLKAGAQSLKVIIE